MSVHARSEESFRSLLRIAAASVADPPWFAAPVDAEEDAGSITVAFYVPEPEHGPPRVSATEQSLSIWSGKRGQRRRAMRLCTLPCPIAASEIEITRAGDVVRVRMPKKGAAASQETSPAT
jgi:hypothetical protein